MSAAEYRAAVIGHTGRGNFGHGIITAFVGIPNVEMVAVADPDPAGRAEAADQSGAPRAYADPYDMLQKEHPNLVAIATRQPDQHHDLFLAAAEVGAHIFSEKPLARSLDEADRMLAATDSRGLKVAMAHVWRVYPGVQRARTLLQEGAIGQLRFMRSYGVMDHRGGGQCLMVLGTHTFDLMRYMTGTDPQWCQARVVQDGRDATAADVRPGDEEIGLITGDGLWAAYGFPNGVTATYESYVGDGSAPTYGLELHGSDGILIMRNDACYRHPRPYAGPVVDAAMGTEWEKIAAPPVPDPPGTPENAPPQHPLNNLVVTDLLAAAAEDREPLCSGHGARWSLEMILAVYEAHRTGERVPLPLADRTHPLSRW